MTITATISSDAVAVSGANWGADEAELRLWVDPGLPGKPRELETHRQLLEEGEELTLTLAKPGEGAAEDGRFAASASQLLSERGEREFKEAFWEYAPEGFDADMDAESDSPYCAPWYWARADQWYEASLTVEEMGKRWAVDCYEELEEIVRHYAEEEEE